jgi:gamma-glutamyltranspeptidase/glutathione hydrolase
MRQKKTGRRYSILVWTGALLAVIILALGAVYLALPKGPRDSMAFNDPHLVDRPAARAERYMAATGTPWATQAALDTMENGGNAVDGAVAALLTFNVTYGEAASFPGVAPVMVYNAESKTVESYTGAGTAPARANIDLFLSRGWKTVPKMDIWSQLLPASPDVIIALLQKYGTKSFTELSAPAIKLAREGFPVHDTMLKNLNLSLVERIGFSVLMPYNSQVYLGGQWWRPLSHGEIFRRPELADTFELMARAEQQALAKGGTREDGLRAVRDVFYKGAIAEKIVAFHKEKGGLFTAADLAGYKGYWEKPVTGAYGPYTICANDTWNQGAVLPMALQVLAGIDLKSMGHNSPEYVHTIVQAIELCMADREAYFGDPQFVKVPIKGLLDARYAGERRKLLTPGRAFGKMPEPGDPWKYEGTTGAGGTVGLPVISSSANPGMQVGKDTSYIGVIDAKGNAVSLTPSDFPQTPMVPGTGLTLGNRMNQFRLDPKNVDSLQPGKRPRITPNAPMALKDGELFMAFGTPGGDTQTQTNLQVFLNIVVFGMDPQQAVNAPRFQSFNFPDSFAPNVYKAGTIGLELPLYNAAGSQLAAMGYKVESGGAWDNKYGAANAIIRDPQTGRLIGGADPREESWAAGK